MEQGLDLIFSKDQASGQQSIVESIGTSTTHTLLLRVLERGFFSETSASASS